MANLAITPANLPKIVILPSKDAELIDEVISGALRRDPGRSANSGRGQQPVHQRAAALSLDQERQRHESAVSILVDAVSPSPSHLWHFLDSLGASLNKPADVDSATRGLLLLHGFLRACSRSTFQETVKVLLGTNSRQSSEAGSKPQLDLLKLTLPGSFQFAKPQLADTVQAQQFERAVAGVRAYAKFLLQRLASSRFVFLPVNKSQVDPSKAAAQVQPADFSLGQAYWAQQGSADVMTQLQALQRLQEGVFTCGTACASWLHQTQGLSEAPRAPVWMPSSALGVRIVLETMLRDSFALFSAINYGLMELIERIGRVPKEQGMQALQVCRTSDSQGRALSDFYVQLGSLNIGQGVEFPAVAVMGDSYISSLEQYVGDGQQSGTPRAGTAPNSVVLFNPGGNNPSPEQAQPQVPPQPAQPTYVQVAAAHQFEATSQALFGKYAPPPSSPYLALPGPSAGHAAAPVPAAGQIVPYNPNPVKAAWEMALDSSIGSAHGAQGAAPAAALQQSILQMAPATQFSGGFDQLLLDSMYETAQAQRRASEAAARAQVQANRGHDPFAASASVAPPSYVQMAARAQQQVAVEMQKKLMQRHASIASEWNTYGQGVKYGGNATVPF